MLSTSYFANVLDRNHPSAENVIPVSISRMIPAYFDGIAMNDVAPSQALVMASKNGLISDAEYRLRYQKEVLDHLDLTAFLKHLAEVTGVEDPVGDKEHLIVLCCYEKNGEFCHRHLLADYLTEKGIPVREAKKKELIEGKLMEEKKEKTKQEEKNILGEVREEMYGSVHSHAEDMFDTGNDLKEWMVNFMRRGAKKVALTGHGSMFAYEDLKGILASMKKEGEIDKDFPFEIIPGVEIYFTGMEEEEESAEDEEEGEEKKTTGQGVKSKHMVLIAKNYDGYVDLCRIISEASRNTKTAKGSSSEDMEYLTPLVTMENLKKNVRKGNLVATSACVGGVFSTDLGMTEYILREKLQKEIDKVGGDLFYVQYEENKRIVSEYLERKESPYSKKPKEADRKKAIKEVEKTGDTTLLEEWDRHDLLYGENKLWLENHKEEYAQAKKKIGQAEKKMDRIEKAKRALEDYLAGEEKRRELLIAEYKQLEEIFGKEDFYFELQNHGLSFEREIFQRVAEFAYAVGNPHFIASNDVHIGDFKGSKTWEQSVLKRKVERYKRFKNIEKDRGDEQEYGIKSDEELREALLSILEPVMDPNGVMHSPEEIVTEAIGNIRRVLEPCKVVFPEISVKGLNHYPKFCEDEGAELRKLVEEGIPKRFPNGLPEGYRERIEYEMDIIHTMGFDGYFLIVENYLRYGRLLGYLRTQEEIDNAPLTIEELEEYIDKLHIPRIGMGIGPGRGSATGCLISYLIEITELDPIPLGLYFERFLNPSRGSMPDIDSDFKDDIREKVYEYIKAHYGDECVSKVATKSYTHGKGAVLLMQQYMLTEYEDAEKEKMNAFLAEKRPTLSQEAYEALEKEEKEILKGKVASKKAELLATKAQISKLFDAYVKENDINMTNHPERGTKALQEMMELFTEPQKEMAERAVEIAGIPATLGMHACACLISGDPLRDVIPLAWNAKNQKMTTQCLYPQAEELGLLKMDLLNIKNLTVITRVMQETEDKRIAEPEEVAKILQDKRIYKEIYSAGKTLGIFQVESPGMTKMMKDFQPSCFEDIILLVAAYRPGPLSFIPEIIQMKRHREDPEHNPMPVRSLAIDNEELQRILAPTYGVPIYQEQVMQIFQQVAGYNLADADNVRRYMSKKKMEPLMKEKPFFIHGDPERGIRGCIGAGMTEAEAELLFDKLVEFSKYAFNKSHAAAYAQVSVYTAYQKLYHPLQFYKHTLSNEIQDGAGKENPITKYMGEMKSMGIGILPPMIGKSRADFTDENNNIRIGYGNIKGQSYKDYMGDVGDSIMGFITKNPDISLTTVETFIKLGMFDRCWNTQDTDAERTRVGGSRALMLKWLNGQKETDEESASPSYGEMIKKYAQVCRTNHELLDRKTGLEQEIRSLEEKEDPTDEQRDHLAELRVQLLEVSEESASVYQTLRLMRDDLQLAKSLDINPPIKGDSFEATKEFHKYETEALGFPFSMTRDIAKLPDRIPDIRKNAMIKAETYSDLMEKKEQIVSDPSRQKAYADIPALVISATQKTSKNGNDYYILQLMDKESNIFTARYFPKENGDPFLMENGVFNVCYQKPTDTFGESFSVYSIRPLEKKQPDRSTDAIETLSNGQKNFNIESFLSPAVTQAEPEEEADKEEERD